MSKIIEKIKKDKSKSIVIGSSIIIFMIGIVVTAFNTNNTYASSGLDADPACYFCTGTSSNGNNYFWGIEPTVTCNGGVWQEKNVTQSNCKAPSTCHFCTGTSSNGDNYFWGTEPTATCNGGVWQEKNVTQSNCKAPSTCHFCTGTSSNGDNYFWGITPTATCNGGVWQEKNVTESECKAPVTYTITYNANGGSGAPSPQTKIHGVNLTLTSVKPIRDGYTFLGWDNRSTVTSPLYHSGDPYTSDTSATLYAIWQANSTDDGDNNTGSGDSGNTGTGGSGNTGSGDSGNTGTGGGGTTTPTTHKVRIRYKVEGGTITSSTTLNGDTHTWSTASDGTIIKDGNVLEDTVNYNEVMPDHGLANYNHPNYVNINRTGYTTDEGKEWKCLSGCTEPGKTFDQGHSYSASDFCDASEGDCTVTVGVNWRPTKVKIRYNVNEGTIEPTTATTNEDGSVTTNSWTTNSDGTIIKNGDILETKVNYNQKMDNNGLANYNSYLYIDIKKQGYTTDEVKEWKCLEGCTEPGKIFNQSFSYNASDFCDASNGDCTVTVGVNWVGIKYFIEYDLNGGIVTTDSPPEGTWNTNVTIDNPTKKVTIHGNQNRTSATISKDVSRDQDFEGWTSPTINKSTAYHGDTEWKDGNVKVKDTIFKNLTSNQGGRVKMIANWKPVAVNLPTVSKNGYTCNWNTKADGKGTKYDSGARYTIESESPATINLYAKCISNSKEDDDISTPPKTGDVLIVIAWAVGIGALGYAVYYFRGRKSNI